MNIALISKKFINNDISYNLSVILNTMDELTQQVDFICFGEAFLQGFDCLSWDYSTDKNIGISCSSFVINTICKKAIDCKIAVAFGYIESDAERLFSSYMVISKFGKIIYNYRRISTGWKESIADYHYQDGADCLPFEIDGITFSIGLCGDLWDDSIINSIAILNTNITLWPVYLDYSESKWNDGEKIEYAKQSALFNSKVLLVNSLCDGANKAKGASAYFVDGLIKDEVLPGSEKALIIEV